MSSQLKKIVLGSLVVVLAVSRLHRMAEIPGAFQTRVRCREAGLPILPKIRFASRRMHRNSRSLQIKPVDDYPEPLVESLNARLAYDDNHTARVFSPIAGRVLKITADAGREIRAGDELLMLDAPDYAQATADDVKAKADLQRKRQAYERASRVAESKWHLAKRYGGGRSRLSSSRG